VFVQKEDAKSRQHLSIYNIWYVCFVYSGERSQPCTVPVWMFGVSSTTGMLTLCTGSKDSFTNTKPVSHRMSVCLQLTHQQKRAPRNKVPLEKGFSQVDWIRISRSGADFTGEGCGPFQYGPKDCIEQPFGAFGFVSAFLESSTCRMSLCQWLITEPGGPP
jgi:hypothetical protein